MLIRNRNHRTTFLPLFYAISGRNMSVKSSSIVEQLGLNQSFGKRAQNGPKGSNLTSFSFALK